MTLTPQQQNAKTVLENEKYDTELKVKELETALNGLRERLDRYDDELRRQRQRLVQMEKGLEAFED